MKREHWIIGLIAVVAVLYFTWPRLRAGYAAAKNVWNPQNSYVVDGTAHSGADATVLTNIPPGVPPAVRGM